MPRLSTMVPLVALSLSFLSAAGLMSQQQEQGPIVDLRTSPRSTQNGFGVVPSTTVELGGRTFFALGDDLHGRELWATDGTAEGTSIFLDICPGACSSNPDHLVSAGSNIFFFADDGVGGIELWASDGSAKGSGKVADLAAGESRLFHVTALALGERVIFTAQDSSSSPTKPLLLWSSDGTREGTVQLAELFNPRHRYAQTAFTRLGEHAYFGVAGALWRTDGTVAGTEEVKPISQDPEASLESFGVGLDKVFFVYDDTLFVSDGTAAGTQELRYMESARYFAEKGSEVFFFEDCRLWATDGTTPGTRFIRDVANGQCPYNLVSHLDLLFFGNVDQDGREVWVSDGTYSGTHQIVDTNPEGQQHYLQGLIPLGDGVYYTNSTGFWRTDGTAEGTTRLTSERLSLFRGQGQFLLASGGHDLPDPLELLLSDGTTQGTVAFTQVQRTFSSSQAQVLTDFQDRIYLLGRDDESEKLFSRSIADSGDPEVFYQDPDGELFSNHFFAQPQAVAFQNSLVINVDGLLISDGSAGSVTSVGADLNSSGRLTPLNDYLFFAGNTFAEGQEPWSSDLSEAGTRLLADILPGGTNGTISPPTFGDSRPQEFTSFAGKVFFSADGGLWQSDANGNNTLLLLDPAAGNFPSHPSGLTAFGQWLLFAAEDSNGDRELWRTDGTAGGTEVLLDLQPGPEPSSPQYLTPFQQSIYFVTGNSTGNGKLWLTDGTATGAQLVLDLGAESWAALHDLTVAGNRLFFSAITEAEGRELWQTDGTAGGTGLVVDLFAGPASSNPRHLIAYQDSVLFAAQNAEAGVELWQSDGTPGGTRRLTDINSGAGSGDPSFFHLVGDELFFSAGNEETGRELYRVTLPLFADGFESGDLRRWSQAQSAP